MSTKPSVESSAPLQIQFRDLEQQRETAIAGMWLFLTTEVMFFGGATASYVIYWYLYPEVWREFSRHLDVLLGTINTVVLLSSSLLVAMAVRAAHAGQVRKIALLLAMTALLGVVFLGIKAYEWQYEYQKGFFPGAWGMQNGEAFEERGNLYFRLYFALTGLHALHVFIGVVLLSVIAVLAAMKRFSIEYNTPVEVSGLYWHFVDVVWIFLFPMLYLVERT